MTKKLLYALAIVFAAALTIVSCSKEETPDVIGEDGLITITQDVVVEYPETRADSLGGTQVTGKITATFDPATDYVVYFSISQEMLDEFELTQAEFNELMREYLGDDFLNVNSPMRAPGSPDSDGSEGTTETPKTTTTPVLDTPGDEYSHSKCIEACKQQYTRKNGLGRCKFNCWVDTVIEILRVFPRLW